MTEVVESKKVMDKARNIFPYNRLSLSNSLENKLKKLYSNEEEVNLTSVALSRDQIEVGKDEKYNGDHCKITENELNFRAYKSLVSKLFHFVPIEFRQ